MDVKYQVFISSTFQDLGEERRVVMEQILNLGHIPVGMELFQAGNDSQWAYIKRRISECDYYLVIVAERYGSEEDGKSYTQLEYEWAVEQGIPVAAFLLHDEARTKWPQNRVEPEKRGKVEGFRAICQRKLVKYWSNADQLGARVTTTLVEMFRENPRPGWVRGDTASSAAALDEIARLSDEKRKMQEELERFRTAGALSPSADIAHRLRLLSALKLPDYIKDATGNCDLTLLEAFVMTSRVFAGGATAYEVGEGLKKLGVGYSFDFDALAPFLAELSANNLISLSYVQGGSDGRITSRKTYHLTEYGKEFLIFAEGPVDTSISDQ